jgi:hypothetical protein
MYQFYVTYIDRDGRTKTYYSAHWSIRYHAEDGISSYVRGLEERGRTVIDWGVAAGCRVAPSTVIVNS